MTHEYPRHLEVSIAAVPFRTDEFCSGIRLAPEPVRQYGREVFDSSCLACRRSGFDDCAGCGVAEEG